MAAISAGPSCHFDRRRALPRCAGAPERGGLTCSEAALEPPRFISRMLTGRCHLSVVKLGHGTGLANDGVARPVVIPPAVAIRRAARAAGSYCVVRGATN